jgi:cyclophilin family peptidyl-prolyl cis-trans isomerase
MFIMSALTPDQRVDLALSVKDKEVTLSDSTQAIVKTSKGSFILLLYGKDAPISVKNFVRLAEAGFYDGLTFHRYEPGFVIQGGDPQGTGVGDAGYTIPLETSDRKHIKGALGMARAQDPNSGSCQFYICLEAQPGLDGSYTVFGEVIKGMSVVNQLRVGDQIIKIKIIR